MKAVLKQGANYFVGMTRDKFDLEREQTSTQIQDARVFDVGVEGGKPTIRPDPPEGDWDIQAVTLTIA